MLDLDKTYGLCLEGGGFRGSYQAGVIIALVESGVRFGAVCGTSIGSLNAAFLAMNDLDRLKKLWHNFEISDIFEVQNEDLERALMLDFKNANLIEVAKKILETTINGGLKIDPLLNLIDREIDEDKVRNSDIKMGLVTYNLSDFQAEELMIDDMQQGDLKKYLMASSYFPAFKRVKLDGKYYMDGGIYNNLPSNMLANLGYDDIIQIRLHKISKNIKPDRKVKLYTISSKEHLGPVIIYKKDKILSNFENGYRDGLEFVKNEDF